MTDPSTVPPPERDRTGSRALVWFKRDLRLRDHAPLAEAMRFDQDRCRSIQQPHRPP